MFLSMFNLHPPTRANFSPCHLSSTSPRIPPLFSLFHSHVFFVILHLMSLPPPPCCARVCVQGCVYVCVCVWFSMLLCVWMLLCLFFQGEVQRGPPEWDWISTLLSGQRGNQVLAFTNTCIMILRNGGPSHKQIIQHHSKLISAFYIFYVWVLNKKFKKIFFKWDRYNKNSSQSWPL